MAAFPTIEEINVARVREGLNRSRSALPFVGELDEILDQRLSSRFDRLALEVEDQLTDPRTRSRGLQLGEQLISEVMTYLAGAAAWKANLAGPVPLLALRWLDGLSSGADLPEVGLVVPASTEYLGVLAQVIRLRVPDDGLWGLPVAVHEYGHFVAIEYAIRTVDAEGMGTSTSPVEDFLRAAGAERPNRYRRGHELFADAVAAMLAGPAYAYYCLRYRFDPAAPATDSHPAPALRMQTILDVLRRLAPEDPSGYLQAATDKAATSWVAQCQARGVSPEPPADDQADLARQLVALAVGNSHLRLVRYADHNEAAGIADALADRTWTPAGPFATVLNGAWERRIRLEESGVDVAGVNQAVRDLNAQVLPAMVDRRG